MKFVPGSPATKGILMDACQLGENLSQKVYHGNAEEQKSNGDVQNLE